MIRPQKGSISGDLSSGSSMYQLNSKPTGSDLLEEHLGEIQNLRQRLEESICINERLREQLEHRLSSTARRSRPTSNFYSPGLGSTPQLCNENRVLREENQRFQAQLSHVFRGEIPKGSAMHSSPVTLAFQEPCKKRSHQKSLKLQGGWACPPSS
nr:myomegalin [Kogia breviceps]